LSKLRELVAWELQENWAFPVLELILAIAIIQVLPIVTFSRSDPDLLNDVSSPFWSSMVFVFAISVAIVFGRSFGEGVEKRKLVVLLCYPVSRVQVFAAKFLANLLTTLAVFGSVLLVAGALLFMFEPSIPWYIHYSGVWMTYQSIAPVIWILMFLSLFLVVFFASSLMTFLTLLVKRFGLSVLIFLIYVFGMEYWTGTVSIRVPEAYLSLDLGPRSIVTYLSAWYYNTLSPGGWWTGEFDLFLTAFCYLLMGGVVFLLASFVLMWRIDLD